MMAKSLGGDSVLHLVQGLFDTLPTWFYHNIVITIAHTGAYLFARGLGGFSSQLQQ
jgi:hypothetical protein